MRTSRGVAALMLWLCVLVQAIDSLRRASTDFAVIRVNHTAQSIIPLKVKCIDLGSGNSHSGAKIKPLSSSSFLSLPLMIPPKLHLFALLCLFTCYLCNHVDNQC